MTRDYIKLTNSRYRLGYHIAAPAGWINDPNGFCFFKGYYHIFYQYHPYSASWGPMHWGHARSQDLIHWENLPTALTPGDPEDKDGCFSGSAIVKDDRLYLIYTGHHYYPGDNDPEHFWQNQNMAYSDDGITFTKYKHNPIIALPPKDNTQHFRDPKVWQIGRNYYLVLGSQETDGLGRVILYKSANLVDWTYLGPIAKAKTRKTEGYMWECPDLFSLDNQDILLLSPQGIEPQAKKYLNLNQTGYFIGELDLITNQFKHAAFTELDHGHDFYATQTMLAPDGRRLLFAWMAMWENHMPEQQDGWAGALIFPRELKLKGNHLYMNPVKELTQLRTRTLSSQQFELSQATQLVKTQAQVELQLTLDLNNFKGHHFNLNLTDDHDVAQLILNYDIATHEFTLKRKDRSDPRYATIKPTNIIELHILVDTSSIEIFINSGETVFTERFYLPTKPSIWLNSDSPLMLKSEIYQLSNEAIDYGIN